MPAARSFERVLAIDPTTRGFAYVVLENPKRLIRWGIKESHEPNRAHYERQLAGLLKLFTPTILVVEDLIGGSRSPNVQDLMGGLVELVRAAGISAVFITRKEVKATFSGRGGMTHQAIAQLLAQDFPELAHRLPPPRKPWMSEDRRIRIFTALALALTYSSSGKRCQAS